MNKNILMAAVLAASFSLTSGLSALAKDDPAAAKAKAEAAKAAADAAKAQLAADRAKVAADRKAASQAAQADQKATVQAARDATLKERAAAQARVNESRAERAQQIQLSENGPPPPPAVAASIQARIKHLRTGMTLTAEPSARQYYSTEIFRCERLLKHWDGKTVFTKP